METPSYLIIASIILIAIPLIKIGSSIYYGKKKGFMSAEVLLLLTGATLDVFIWGANLYLSNFLLPQIQTEATITEYQFYSNLQPILGFVLAPLAQLFFVIGFAIIIIKSTKANP